MTPMPEFRRGFPHTGLGMNEDFVRRLGRVCSPNFFFFIFLCLFVSFFLSVFKPDESIRILSSGILYRTKVMLPLIICG